MKKREPNWGLAFGSGCFLIVWSLGFLSGLPIEIVALRAAAATVLGGLVGFGITHVIGLFAAAKALEEARNAKGSQVDFTVAEDLFEDEEGLTHVVPEAEASDPEPPADFKPMDFRTAARHVRQVMKE